MTDSPQDPGPFTLRAFAVGSALAFFVSVACPYTVFITAGAVFLFFALTGLVNSVLRWIHRPFGLHRGELIIVYAMMIVASAIPTWGLMANLLPVLPGAYYYATPENGWDQLIQPFIPTWLAPQDPSAIKYFYEGLPTGSPIPWDAWLQPLLMWCLLILSSSWIARWPSVGPTGYRPRRAPPPNHGAYGATTWLEALSSVFSKVVGPDCRGGGQVGDRTTYEESVETLGYYPTSIRPVLCGSLETGARKSIL